MTKSEPLAAEGVTMLDVGKTYGDFRALTNVCLNVARGEKIVICGPSGSGKSTMIRCVNRIENTRRRNDHRERRRADERDAQHRARPP